MQPTSYVNVFVVLPLSLCYKQRDNLPSAGWLPLIRNVRYSKAYKIYLYIYIRGVYRYILYAFEYLNEKFTIYGVNVKKLKPAESLLKGKSKAKPGQQFLVIVNGRIWLTSIMLLSGDHYVVRIIHPSWIMHMQTGLCQPPCGGMRLLLHSGKRALFIRARQLWHQKKYIHWRIIGKKRAIIENSWVEKFFNSDFNPTVYESIIFEKFNSTFIVQPTILKRLLEGCSYAHPVTGCPEMKRTFPRVALSSVMYILMKLQTAAIGGYNCAKGYSP